MTLAPETIFETYKAKIQHKKTANTGSVRRG